MKAVETEFPLVVNPLPSPGSFKTPGRHSMFLVFSNPLTLRRYYLLRETGTPGNDLGFEVSWHFKCMFVREPGPPGNNNVLNE